MAFRMTEMTVLRSTAPQMFKTKMKATIVKHSGHAAHIAQDLGVSHTTIKRWLGESPEMKLFVKRVRAKRAA